MNEKILKKFRKGKGIHKALKTPMFILKIKGKRDAKKGVNIAETYINKGKAKCRALENREVLTAEEILYDSRREAAVLMSSMCQDKYILGNIPNARAEASPLDVRANRRNAAQRANTISIIKGNFEKLVQINELIIDINACLEQRILKTRHLCTERLNAYILGVREVHLEFDNNNEYDDSASTVYEAKHKACEEAIKNMVAMVYATGGNDDEVV